MAVSRASWIKVQNGRLHLSLHKTSWCLIFIAFGCITALVASSVYNEPALRRSIARRFQRNFLFHWQQSELKIDDEERTISPNHIRNRRGLGLSGNVTDGYVPVTMPQPFEHTMRSVGENFYRHFHFVDVNHDAYINPYEFQQLMTPLEPIKYANNAHFEEVLLGEPTIAVNCYLKALQLTSMTKIVDKYAGTNVHYLDGLLDWNACHQLKRNFSQARLLRALLPSPNKTTLLGQVYYVIAPPNAKDRKGAQANQEFNSLHLDISNRYFTPIYEDENVRFIQQLLAMFHPNSFPSTRMAPYGSVALIRAKNENYMEIVFRIHAEFQLNQPPNYPFWFTPAYFYGSMITNAEATHLYYFNMAIPRLPDKKLNIDMEWLQTPMTGLPESDGIIEVDIGYADQMELSSIEAAPSTGTWKESITSQLAFQRLELELYPFNRVEYVQFGRAFELSSTRNLLVHSILLWGTLNDQSC